MKLPVIVTGSALTVFIKNKPYTVKRSAPNYTDVANAVMQDLDELGVEKLLELLQPIKVIKTSQDASTGFYVDEENYTLLYNGERVHSTVASRVSELLAIGFDVQPVVNFLNKLQKNPSYRSVQCLYDFLEANNIPLTPDGDFLVFKKVKDNYFDYHSGKFDNSVGKLVRVERNQVDEDPDRTCSRGLHVCAEHYLQSYYGSQGRVVVCKVNPEHVVAVPKDYNNSKMRVSEYLVVSEIPEEDAKKYFNAPVMEGTERYIYEDEDDSGDYYSDVGVLDYTDDDRDYDPDTNMCQGDEEYIDVMGFNVTHRFEGYLVGDVAYTFTYKNVSDTYYESDFDACLEKFENEHVKTTETFLVTHVLPIDGGTIEFSREIDVVFKGDSNQSEGLAISRARENITETMRSNYHITYPLTGLQLTGCEIVDVKVEIV